MSGTLWSHLGLASGKRLGSISKVVEARKNMAGGELWAVCQE